MAKKRKTPRYVRDEKAQAYRVPRRLPADESQQVSNNSYDSRTYYEDLEYVCRDCGRREIWTADQQKWWYEVAKGPIQSTAIRCRECRRLRAEKHVGLPRKSHADRRREAEERKS